MQHQMTILPPDTYSDEVGAYILLRDGLYVAEIYAIPESETGAASFTQSPHIDAAILSWAYPLVEALRNLCGALSAGNNAFHELKAALILLDQIETSLMDAEDELRNRKIFDRQDKEAEIKRWLSGSMESIAQLAAQEGITAEQFYADHINRSGR